MSGSPVCIPMRTRTSTPSGQLLPAKACCAAMAASAAAPSVLEDDEELVAAVIDDVSASLFHGSAEKLAVVGQNLGVPVPQALKELRRSFDVGEEEGDGSIGKGRHLRLLQWNLGTNSGARSRRALDCKLAIQ